MKRYEGKKVVILGATSGMGLTTAKMLLAEGASVLVTGRLKEGVESAQKELGNEAIVVSSDARSLTDLDALASRAKARFDTIDLLFVNAGFSIRASLESITEAIYDEVFNLNAKGPFFAVQKFAPLIHRGGSVVLTTSIANVKSMAGLATYGAAKAALRSFARTLAAELIPHEIRVNAVTPGPIDTPIVEKAFPAEAAAKMREKMAGMVPMQRWGMPEEIAKAVLFLAFDATFTTGAELPVDGGSSQLRRLDRPGSLDIEDRSSMTLASAVKYSSPLRRGKGPQASRGVRGYRDPYLPGDSPHDRNEGAEPGVSEKISNPACGTHALTQQRMSTCRSCLRACSNGRSGLRNAHHEQGSRARHVVEAHLVLTPNPLNGTK